MLVIETDSVQAAEADTLNPEYIQDGRKLFSGRIALENGGPSCISCHHVTDKKLAIGGGKMGLDLTTIYKKFGEKAVRGFIRDSPFPVMKSAFKKHPITEEEVDKLTAYLQYLSQQKTTQEQPFSSGNQFLFSGLLGLVLIVGGIWMLWRKRKRGSVNDPIYERQIQST